MSRDREGISNKTGLSEICQKTQSPDVDHRYMALNDLLGYLESGISPLEDAASQKLTEVLLKCLEDTNGEVQNVSVKCLGPLIRRSKEQNVQIVIDRLCKAGSESTLRDISSTALRSVILEISPNSTIAGTITQRLVPKILAQLDRENGNSDRLLETIDVLTELAMRFGRALGALTFEEHTALLDALIRLLSHTRPAVRKRSTVALAYYSIYLPKTWYESFIERIAQMFATADTAERLKALTNLVNQTCRHSSYKFSAFAQLESILTCILSAVDAKDSELQDLSIQCMETFVLTCSHHLEKHMQTILDLALKYLTYDPNYAINDTEEEGFGVDDSENEGSDSEIDDSDFVDFDEFSEDDDQAWKVRRSATKLLEALVSTQGALSDLRFAQAATVLATRLGDREENVRTENLKAFAMLVRRTKISSNQSYDFENQSEDLGPFVSEPSVVITRQILVDIMPRVMRSLIKQLSLRDVPTLQAGFFLAHELVSAYPSETVPYHLSFVECARSAMLLGTSNNSQLTASLRLEVMRLLSSLLLQLEEPMYPYLVDIAHLILNGVSDRSTSVALAALTAARSLSIRACQARNEPCLIMVYTVLIEKSSSVELEQNVRDKSIETLGEAISVTPHDICEGQQMLALQKLSDRMNSEATRLVAINAVSIAVSCQVEPDPNWTITTIASLVSCLKSISRALRISSLNALSSIVNQIGRNIDQETTTTLVCNLTPMILVKDLQISSLVLSILTQLVSYRKGNLSSLWQDSLSSVTHLAGNSSVQKEEPILNDLNLYLSALCDLGLGAEVLLALAPYETDSSRSSVLARFVATVLLSDDAQSLDEYVKDIADPETGIGRRVFCLTVIGEYGQRRPLCTDIALLALAQSASQLEQVQGAAAFALGNIVLGNPIEGWPLVVRSMSTVSIDQYFLVLAIKETLSQTKLHNDLLPYLTAVWTELFSMASEERGKNAVAECLGRLTLIDPKTFLPQLQSKIASPMATTRSAVIRAVRYTLMTANTDLDELLKYTFMEYLLLMEDSDLEIRKLALSTLCSAIRNKPFLIMENLLDLTPLLLAKTLVREDLIHTVQMGPFKHVVDEGLELRKIAFETMHALSDSPFSKFDIAAFYDSVISGLTDAHEIRILCNMMISLFARRAPYETSLRLDEIAEQYSKIIHSKLKDTAVKQAVEKDNESKKSIIRTTASLRPIATHSTTRFNAYVEELLRGPWATELQSTGRLFEARNGQEPLEY